VGAVSIFQTDPHEPLALFLRDAESLGGSAALRQLEFELSSRGDRVPGRLLLPADRRGPFPLILAQHGIGGAKDSDYMDTACLPWVRGGAAVASIDFPLHGERASAKLSERIQQFFEASSDLSPLAEELWISFVRQAVIDLRRTVDAMVELPEIDAGRVGYAGFSLGTILGVPFCAEDPRVRAAALAIGGGGVGPVATDPVRHIPRFAPRPVLFVSARRDQTIPRERAEALHEAAGEPSQVLWFDCAHSELPGAALKAMWRFLGHHLEVQLA
jgi:dienelactone hydrolase